MSEHCSGSLVVCSITAFAAGAAVGAVVALLYAPQSGKETREMVSKRVKDVKNAAGDAIEEGKHLAHEVYDKGKEAARDIGNAARDAGNAAKDVGKAAAPNRM